MPDYVLRHSASLANIWTDHGLVVVGYLDANPGSTFGEVAVGIGLNSNDVQYIFGLLQTAGALYQGQDTKGGQFFWTTWTFSQTVIGALNAVRDWVLVHDNVTVAQIAAQFSIHEAVAFKIASILQAERNVTIAAVV